MQRKLLCQYGNRLAIRNPQNNFRLFWKKYTKNFIVKSVFKCTMHTVRFLNKLYLSHGIQERQQDFYTHGPLLKSSDSALKFFKVPDIMRYTFLILYFSSKLCSLPAFLTFATKTHRYLHKIYILSHF